LFHLGFLPFQRFALTFRVGVLVSGHKFSVEREAEPRKDSSSPDALQQGDASPLRFWTGGALRTAPIQQAAQPRSKRHPRQVANGRLEGKNFGGKLKDLCPTPIPSLYPNRHPLHSVVFQPLRKPA
jgi:hypothetical protein